MTAGILSDGSPIPASRTRLSRRRHQYQPGGVERHVRHHAQTEPTGAHRADAEHEADDEQTGDLDRLEVDEREPQRPRPRRRSSR